MRLLNSTETKEVNNKFPGLKDFGLRAIFINDDRTPSLTFDYEVPKGISFDKDMKSLHEYISKNFNP